MINSICCFYIYRSLVSIIMMMVGVSNPHYRFISSNKGAIDSYGSGWPSLLSLLLGYGTEEVDRTALSFVLLHCSNDDDDQ